jgi:uncharacterized protein YegL
MPAERVTSFSPWHIIFVIDDSSSMKGPGAAGVNESMDVMIEELKLLSQGVKPYFRISVVKFGSRSEVIAEVASEQNIHRDSVTKFDGTSGSTDIAAGLRDVKLILNRNPGEVSHFVPFVFLLSDGEPDDADAAKAVAAEIKQMAPPAGRPRIVTIGVGSKPDDDFLMEIATRPELYKKLDDPKELSKLFPAIGTIASSSGGAEAAESAIVNI